VFSFATFVLDCSKTTGIIVQSTFVLDCIAKPQESLYSQQVMFLHACLGKLYYCYTADNN